jgi:urease accessory protein
MRIEVTPDGCRLGHGPLAARRLRSSTPGVVRVGLVATQALLLAGDAIAVEVDVRGPVTLELVEPAGTVAYDMRGGSATWTVAVTLSDRAALTWLAEPFVVAAGALVTRSTTLSLEEGTRARVRESLVLGRTGEVGGALVATTHATYAGAPLLVESLDLSPAERSGPAVLFGHRCVDSLLSLGERLPDGPGVLHLEGPGSVARWVGDQQHLSPL